MPMFATNMVVTWAKYSGVDLGLWRAPLHVLTRRILAHNNSDSWSYDGDYMAGSSC